jgi:hypothetical protein
MEWATTIDLTKARAQARAVAAAINLEGPPCPTFARASQNVATIVALLDTLPVPSTDRVDKVYHQLKNVLDVTTTQQVENSLQWRAEVSISSPGCSKVSRQRTTIQLPVVGTTSSSAQVLTRLQPGHPSRHPEPPARHQAHRGNEGGGAFLAPRT